MPNTLLACLVEPQGSVEDSLKTTGRKNTSMMLNETFSNPKLSTRTLPPPSPETEGLNTGEVQKVEIY
ncbi:hypothetical protein TNCV_3084781 [Trichonephila clavipes]|nr:hypothetical protein TNCV_3084781 [Trichonephila clavipes]